MACSIQAVPSTSRPGLATAQRRQRARPKGAITVGLAAAEKAPDYRTSASGAMMTGGRASEENG
jgi:hypothetical protein